MDDSCLKCSMHITAWSYNVFNVKHCSTLMHCARYRDQIADPKKSLRHYGP